jgi:hypothetical protein
VALDEPGVVVEGPGLRELGDDGERAEVRRGVGGEIEMTSSAA